MIIRACVLRNPSVFESIIDKSLFVVEFNEEFV